MLTWPVVDCAVGGIAVVSNCATRSSGHAVCVCGCGCGLNDGCRGGSGSSSSS